MQLSAETTLNPINLRNWLRVVRTIPNRRERE